MFRGQKKGLEKVGVHVNSYPHRFAREGTGVELLLIGFDMLWRFEKLLPSKESL